MEGGGTEQMIRYALLCLYLSHIYTITKQHKMGIPFDKATVDEQTFYAY